MRSPTNESVLAITRRGSSGSNLTPTVTRKDSSSGMAAMAVAAAAEATAQYQSSLVHVEVDNEKEANATCITVRAPTRPYLLGDLTGALSGLGLAVLNAALSKVISQRREVSPPHSPPPCGLVYAELLAPARPLCLSLRSRAALPPPSCTSPCKTAGGRSTWTDCAPSSSGCSSASAGVRASTAACAAWSSSVSSAPRRHGSTRSSSWPQLPRRNVDFREQN